MCVRQCPDAGTHETFSSFIVDMQSLPKIDRHGSTAKGRREGEGMNVEWILARITAALSALLLCIVLGTYFCRPERKTLTRENSLDVQEAAESNAADNNSRMSPPLGTVGAIIARQSSSASLACQI
jgi:hypothetical protein